MARDGISRRMKSVMGMFLSSESRKKSVLIRVSLAALIGVALVGATLLTFQANMPQANANALRISPGASCAQLASLSPTVTNGSSWGQTILRGHGAPGGWFGVDVCSNGFNSVTPNGSNVSCSSTSHGCAPTRDGYGLTFQCPELVVRFSAWAFGDNPASWGRSGWGNAPDLWLPVNHPSDFVMYPNGSATPPMPGDILVWGYLDTHGNPWPAGPDGAHGGHIAVVAAVHGGKVITAEQNVKWGSQDHPSDTLALTKVGSRWILSGSSHPATTLPTWRWLQTMGHSRGTYGWLHSVKNNGTFPNRRAGSGSVQSPTTSKSVPQQFPGGLPSLSAATVVTQNGTLADLTWSTRGLFTPAADPDQPRAQARSLGAPPGDARLASGQSAATILLNNGSRYTYALGSDGNLYVARTSPASLGVFWSALGQPPGVKLTGSPVASLFAGGVQIAARGDDGNLWWRAGPPERPGDWFSLGSPSATTLTGGLALAGAPGSGTPVVFALGADGRIYLRIWEDVTTAADGTQLPAGWSDWLPLGSQSSTSYLTGTLLIVPEAPTANNWIGPWSDSPLNLFATDQAGALWWFRSTRLASGWVATQVAGSPAPLDAILGAVAIQSAPSASAASTAAVAGNAIQLYAAGRTASYLCTLTIPAADAHDAQKPIWLALPVAPAGLAETASSAAVALGPGNSVVVAAIGDEVMIGGAQAMTTALLPDSAIPTAHGKPIVNPWLRVGSAPAFGTFSDTFLSMHLDSRWTRSGAGSRARLDGHGLTLIPGQDGIAALTQSASAGDTALTVRVSRPGALPAKGRVGLVLYEDDGDWLTLTVDRAGTVRLCPMAWQEAVSCSTGKANAKTAIWLRLQRSGSAFTALASGDGVTWRPIGGWTPSMMGAAAPHASTPTTHAAATVTATPYATLAPGATPPTLDPPVAPLAFSSWGVLVVGNGAATGWPRFADFVVSASGAA